MKKDIGSVKNGELKLLMHVFGEKEDKFEIMEMTNFFKVTDKNKFNEIISHIKTKEGVLVGEDDGRVSIISYDSISECFPFHIKAEDIEKYNKDDYLDTIELLQGILVEGEVILLQSVLHNKTTGEIDKSLLKIYKDKVINL